MCIFLTCDNIILVERSSDHSDQAVTIFTKPVYQCLHNEELKLFPVIWIIRVGPEVWANRNSFCMCRGTWTMNNDVNNGEQWLGLTRMIRMRFIVCYIFLPCTYFNISLSHINWLKHCIDFISLLVTQIYSAWMKYYIWNLYILFVLFETQPRATMLNIYLNVSWGNSCAIWQKTVY